MPVLLDCNFVVDSTNANGLGIRSLKGPYIQNVFMHTTQTAGVGNSNPATPGISVTNPNPASGVIVVQFQDNFNRLLTGAFAVVTPVGSSVSVNGTNLTVGSPYVITALGSPAATAADWVTVGLPKGVTPAVGAAFIAAATGSGTSAALVAPPATHGSQFLQLETIGDSNAAIAPSLTAAQGFGAQMIFRCMSSSANASVMVTPADNSVISMQFLLSNSSVLVQGE